LNSPGTEYRYPEAMLDGRKRCFDQIVNIGKYELGKQHLLPSELWGSMLPGIRDRTQRTLEVLNAIDPKAQSREYRNLATELSSVTGVSQEAIMAIDRSKVMLGLQTEIVLAKNPTPDCREFQPAKQTSLRPK
jgi:hypothetical protein